MRMTKQIEEDSIAGINMAPIINVALVLVIVLIITAPILSIPSIPVNLPRAVTIEAKERNITISYSKDGKVAIDTQVISWKDLVPKLKYRLKENSKALVIIRADKDVPYGEIEKIFDIVIKKAGAKRIAVATEQRREYKEVFK
ncbi:Biopolymer transport protein ExbD [subsurface metagenome]|nr:protein TolR [Bacillota bacterium]MQY64920.1 protein TolR [Clostridia bacterium]